MLSFDWWSAAFAQIWLLGLTLYHQSGRTPLLPLYALLLFKLPSELTLRTLYEFDELGGAEHTLRDVLNQPLWLLFRLSLFLQAAVIRLTSTTSPLQYATDFISSSIVLSL